MTPNSTSPRWPMRWGLLGFLAATMLISAAALAADPIIKKSEYGSGDHKIEF